MLIVLCQVAFHHHDIQTLAPQSSVRSALRSLSTLTKDEFFKVSVPHKYNK